MKILYNPIGHYLGTMAIAEDSTISTHDEGECWEEDFHSLSSSEDEDRGGLVMHWINFHIKHTAASQCVLHLAVWTT